MDPEGQAVNKASLEFVPSVELRRLIPVPSHLQKDRHFQQEQRTDISTELWLEGECGILVCLGLS